MFIQRHGAYVRCCGHGHFCGGFDGQWRGYISVAAGAAAYGFALTASPFLQTPKKEPKTLAPPWAPRWGSGFPLSGIAPGARRQPAIHGRVAASSASMPSCPLRNAYARPAGKGPEDQDQDQKPRCAGRLLVAAAEGCERALALAKPGGAVVQEHWGGRFSVSCGAGRSLRQRLHVTRTAMKQAGRQAAVRF
ncbi:hypothetical protein DWF74_02180 [Pseudomonas protegens]|nr:hypothetical protein DWF74_02180 [Pseudomonas protegens]